MTTPRMHCTTRSAHSQMAHPNPVQQRTLPFALSTLRPPRTSPVSTREPSSIAHPAHQIAHTATPPLAPSTSTTTRLPVSALSPDHSASVEPHSQPASGTPDAAQRSARRLAACGGGPAHNTAVTPANRTGCRVAVTGYRAGLGSLEGGEERAHTHVHICSLLQDA